MSQDVRKGGEISVVAQTTCMYVGHMPFNIYCLYIYIYIYVCIYCVLIYTFNIYYVNIFIYSHILIFIFISISSI